jgi:Flp pilus assembly protein TadG
MMPTIRPIRRRERGQILVIAVLGLVAMLAGAALILEGGNAYAQQRVAQNGSDAAANAGAVVLGQRLAGTTTSDAMVANAVATVGTANDISSWTGRYTNVSGQYLDGSGAVVGRASAATVGGGSIPAGAQGVAVEGTRSFDTVLGRVIGINDLNASASATAVTGRLVGGPFLPIVIPVSIVDCETNGSLGSVPEDMWTLSSPGNPPVGPEYIVPLCKTGAGSFQVLNLDTTPSVKCDDEVANPPNITWETFPVDVLSDPGNDCAKKITDYVNANYQGSTVLIPICDNTVGDPCGTEGGSHAEYRITRVAAFYVDYMSDSNKDDNEQCSEFTDPYGNLVDEIAGNGSSSCIVGWFVRYITAGPVGPGTVGNSDAIGVQLIE